MSSPQRRWLSAVWAVLPGNTLPRHFEDVVPSCLRLCSAVGKSAVAVTGLHSAEFLPVTACKVVSLSWAACGFQFTVCRSGPAWTCALNPRRCSTNRFCTVLSVLSAHRLYPALVIVSWEACQMCAGPLPASLVLRVLFLLSYNPPLASPCPTLVPAR